MIEIEDHMLGDLTVTPVGLVAECECSNPDGERAGYVAFTGATLGEIAVSWLEHIERLEGRA